MNNINMTKRKDEKDENDEMGKWKTGEEEK